VAITLYRKGNTHIDSGIMCEVARIEPSSLEGHLKAGWKMTPQEVGEPDAELLSRPVLKKPVVNEKTSADRTILSSVGDAFDRMRGKA